MALNHYEFYLVEKKSLEDLALAKQFIEGKFFNDKPYWIYSHQWRNLFEGIEQILKRNRSWCNEIDLYGIPDSNCLEVFLDDMGYITSVSFRIDLRDSYGFILKEVLIFCVINELTIIDKENLTELPLDYKLIDFLIKSSNNGQPTTIS